MVSIESWLLSRFSVQHRQTPRHAQAHRDRQRKGWASKRGMNILKNLKKWVFDGGEVRVLRTAAIGGGLGSHIVSPRVAMMRSSPVPSSAKHLHMILLD